MSNGFGPDPQPCARDQAKHEYDLDLDEFWDQRQCEKAGSDESGSIARSDLTAGSDGLGPDPQFDLPYFWDQYDETASSSSSKRAQSTSPSEHGDWEPGTVTTKKRLFICCDGTWQNAVGTNRPLTNVARFARSVKRKGWDDVVQIVYYASGLAPNPTTPLKLLSQSCSG